MKKTFLSKTLSILLSLCILLCMMPMIGLSVSALDATTDDSGAILISTAEQLSLIGVDENYPLNGSYKMTNDIDLSNYGDWTPIANYTGNANIGQPATNGVTYFTGTFDGLGHKISNMTVSVTAGNAYAGLFSVADNATIRNLIVDNASVTANGTYTSQGGVIAGGTSSTTTVLENIAVYNSTVNVTNKAANDRAAAGGLVGWGANGSTLKGCYVDVDVTSAYNAESGESAQMYCSGLVGAGWNGYTTATDSVFVGTLTNNYYIPADDFTPTATYNHKNGVVSSTNTNMVGSATDCYYLDTAGVSLETDKKFLNGTSITAEELSNSSRAQLSLSGEYWRDGVGYPTLIFTLPSTDGNYPDYILIYSAAQLAKIGKDDTYPLNGKYLLANDIDMSDYDNWTPIGFMNEVNANTVSASNSFCGIFNGGGHTIYGLTINTTGGKTFSGLFRGAYDATFENVVFRGANVTATATAGSGKLTYAGILVGTSKTTSGVYNYVKNVAVYDSTISVETYANDNPAVAGGIWGFGEGYVQFENCYSEATVSAKFVTADTTVSESKQVATGGLIGASYGGAVKAINCIFAGTLNAVNCANGVTPTIAYVRQNSIMGANAQGWTLADYEKIGLASKTNCYYLDTAGVNTYNLRGLDGTAISTGTLKTATTASMGFDSYYWANDGEGLYLAVAPVYTNSNGAIEIGTANELSYIGKYSQYPLTGDYVLTADIDLSTYGNWTPIAFNANDIGLSEEYIKKGLLPAFTGSFDGQGHTISNMTIKNLPSKYQLTAGLFATAANGAEFKNLIIKDSTVDASGPRIVYAGALVGYVQYYSNVWCTVNNVAVLNTTVKCANKSGNYEAGVGSVLGNSTSTHLYNIYSNATVEGGYQETGSNITVAGGIAGRAWNGYVNGDNVIFEGTVDCTSPNPTVLYENAIFAYNSNHANEQFKTQEITDAYYNSDIFTPSETATETTIGTNGGHINGKALSNFAMGITTIGENGLDAEYWIHNGHKPVLKIMGGSKYVMGDSNFDKELNILDLVRLKKYLSNITEDICLVATDYDRDLGIDVDDIIYMRKALLGVSNATTVKLFNASEQVKYLGNANAENGILAMHHSNTGFAFTVKAEGDITATLNGVLKNDFPYSRVAVTVDGATQIINITEGLNTYTLASDLEYGKHTVEVLKINENVKGSIYADEISFMGRFEERLADSELTIHFYGDSITAGEGVLSYTDKSKTDYIECQFANLTYAAKTAKTLGADMSVWAQSGTRTDEAVTRFLSETDNRSADIVVINLGTNDWGIISEGTGDFTESGMEAELSAITDVIDAVREKYGTDTKIVWCYGSMGDTYEYESVIMAAVDGYSVEDTGVYYCSLIESADNSGGAGHPTEAGHATSAKILSEFIKNTVLAQ